MLLLFLGLGTKNTFWLEIPVFVATKKRPEMVRYPVKNSRFWFPLKQLTVSPQTWTAVTHLAAMTPPPPSPPPGVKAVNKHLIWMWNGMSGTIVDLGRICGIPKKIDLLTGLSIWCTVSDNWLDLLHRPDHLTHSTVVRVLYFFSFGELTEKHKVKELCLFVHYIQQVWMVLYINTQYLKHF